jgi:hypothetical protein
MIKVEHISRKQIESLLERGLTDFERKFVRDVKRSQQKYPTLTRKKYVYFWLIYNKYFDRELLVQKQVYEEYGLLQETSDAFKKRKQQKYNKQKLERATLEENEREYFKKKGDKHFS